MGISQPERFDSRGHPAPCGQLSDGQVIREHERGGQGRAWQTTHTEWDCGCWEEETEPCGPGNDYGRDAPEKKSGVCTR